MQEKYLNLLNNSKNGITFLSILKGLPKSEISSLFESLRCTTIKEGDYLYRIRKGNIEKEENPWGIPPEKINREFGRFDKNNEILYLAQTDCFLEDECLLKPNERYYLGKYIVTKSFTVGNFIFPNNKYYKISFYLHKICQAINKKNLSSEAQKELRTINELNRFDDPLLASLKTGVQFDEKIYEATNWIGEQILSKNNNGICYSSAYNPIDTFIGDTKFKLDEKTSNIALTKNGKNNIKFIDCIEKVASDRINFTEYIKNYKKIIKENQNENNPKTNIN